MAFNLKVKQYEFSVSLKDLSDLDLISADDNTYHLIDQHRSQLIKILHIDRLKKIVELEVDGNYYAVTIEDEYDQLVKKMGFSASKSKKIKDVKAPMPGLVIEVLVEEGQTIQKGDNLIVLEAMKMENVLKAEGEGVIKKILVEKSNTVDKGSILLELE